MENKLERSICPNSDIIRRFNSNGYIINELRTEAGEICQGVIQRWLISGYPGQRIFLTLYDFAADLSNIPKYRKNNTDSSHAISLSVTNWNVGAGNKDYGIHLSENVIDSNDVYGNQNMMDNNVNIISDGGLDFNSNFNDNKHYDVDNNFNNKNNNMLNNNNFNNLNEKKYQTKEEKNYIKDIQNQNSFDVERQEKNLIKDSYKTKTESVYTHGSPNVNYYNTGSLGGNKHKNGKEIHVNDDLNSDKYIKKHSSISYSIDNYLEKSDVRCRHFQYGIVSETNEHGHKLVQSFIFMLEN